MRFYSRLDDAQCQQLHEATLRVLERTGLIVDEPEGLELLRTPGAAVDGNRVRIPAKLVDWALSATQTNRYRLPHLIAGSVTEAVASARRFPLAYRSRMGETALSDLQFVRRNLDGSVVVRTVYWDHTLWNGHTGPFFTQEYTLKKVGGSWRIATDRQWGTQLDGKVTPDVGG